MNPSTFNPLNPDNIRIAMSDAERRDFERETVQPWYLATACALVACAFLWSVGGALMNRDFPQEAFDERTSTTYCPLYQFESKKPVVCFLPPPPIQPLPFALPQPAPKEDRCPDCDEYRELPRRVLPPVPDVILPPEPEVPELFEGEASDFVAPYITTCGGWVDEVPHPINFAEIKARISYPPACSGVEGAVAIRIQVGTYGQYVQHEVVDESDKRLTQAITPHLSDLKFTPAIQGDRPVPAWVRVVFRFQLL